MEGDWGASAPLFCSLVDYTPYFMFLFKVPGIVRLPQRSEEASYTTWGSSAAAAAAVI